MITVTTAEGILASQLHKSMVRGENSGDMLQCYFTCSPMLALLDKGSSMIPLFEQQNSTGPGLGAHGFQDSISHFTNPWFIGSLLLGLIVAAACGLAIAWHPRRSGKTDPVEDLERRNTLIVLAIVGAIVSELVRVQPAMALVVFGIGGLIRFRTVLDDPKTTGKAIVVVVIGLACGLGQLAMGVFFTAFAWLIIFWLDSSVGFRVRLKLSAKADSNATLLALLTCIREAGGRVASADEYEHKNQIVVIGKVPSAVDPVKFKLILANRLPSGHDIDIDVQIG